jgi:signal transduction histidine kinase
MPALAFLALTALAFGATLGRPYLSESALQRRLWEAHGMVLVALAVGAARALVTARSRRRELTRLVVDLDRSAAAGGMQHVLAQILGDADLRIGYPLTEGGHADSAGHLLQTVPTDGRATTVLTRAGREVAVLVHRVGVLDDPGLVDELASAGSLGLDHERLRAQTRRQLADVRASRARIVAAGDEERRRLERDLHDGAQQRLVGLALTARAMRHHIDDAGEDSLARAEERIRLALDELRDLARGLYPVVLVEEGLAAALDALAESAPLGIRTAPAGRFSAEVETTAYLAIAAATATGPTAVSVKASDDCLTVDLVSRGHPDLQDVPDRVDALGGQLTLEPTTPGTRIVVQLPLGVPTSGS